MESPRPMQTDDKVIPDNDRTGFSFNLGCSLQYFLILVQGSACDGDLMMNLGATSISGILQASGLLQILELFYLLIQPVRAGLFLVQSNPYPFNPES